jgi:hypothetical protein
MRENRTTQKESSYRASPNSDSVRKTRAVCGETRTYGSWRAGWWQHHPATRLKKASSDLKASKNLLEFSMLKNFISISLDSVKHKIIKSR